ncbi:MAG: hypothetical protein IPL61_06865 [Myxococcales bacterium]|nr:hypothetical protein [Myxococcales bacterium]
MIEWLETLPLLLAGPILRRVEPDVVAVWVATREPADVELAIYAGLVASTTNRALFDGATPLATPVTVPTLRVGAKLHVACVMATNVALLPEQLYSYNIAFTAADGRHDLNSLGLLAHSAAGERPHLPLGYDDAMLPSFALPPNTIEHLTIAHGSCRRAGAKGPDALAFLDDLIFTRRNEPLARPHQLFLTGDQIYADDVPKPLLPLCTTLGHYLISGELPERRRIAERERAPHLPISQPVAVQTHQATCRAAGRATPRASPGSHRVDRRRSLQPILDVELRVDGD